MTNDNSKDTVAEIKKLLGKDKGFVRDVVRDYMQEVLENEMSTVLGAAKSERTGQRQGYRSGYCERTLVTRVGAIELRVPQDRNGLFSTELFERCQRSEKVLVATLAEMHVQGVSTRKVKHIAEELCGHSFSASTISNIMKQLDEQLAAFAQRPLDEPFRYVILDARYEKVRENGVVASQAALVALGVDQSGRRQALGVDMANRESGSSWKDFLLGLRERGLSGVEFVVSDDHAGLRKAIPEALPQAAWQRCYVHFLRNALDHMPRKRNDDGCLRELSDIYHRRNLEEAKAELKAWIARWEARYPKLVGWVEESIEETLTFYDLPPERRKHMRSTNMLERLNQEIKRRTLIVRVFPNAKSCLRLVRVLTVETHEHWQEGNRYLNMIHLKERRREQMRKAA